MRPAADIAAGWLNRSYAATIAMPTRGWTVTLAFLRWGVVPTTPAPHGHSLDRASFGAWLDEDPASFEVGSGVIYPDHGLARIVRRQSRTILGDTRDYYVLKVVDSDMTVMVPVENAGKAGLRLAPAFEADAQDGLADLLSSLVASPAALRSEFTLHAAADKLRARGDDEGWQTDLSYFVASVSEDSVVPVEQSPVTSTSLKAFAAAGGGTLSVWLTGKGVVGVVEGGAGIIVLYTSIAIGDLIQRLLGSVGPQGDRPAEDR